MQQGGKSVLVGHWGLVVCLALALLSSFVSGARAQSVREKSSFGLASSYRSMKKDADEQKFTGFPDVREGETGTIARLTFDRSNADISFFTSAAFPSESLLPTARQIAQEMDLPQSDFITVDTKRYHYIDLEMNDYLQKVSRSETRFDCDLSRLRTALEKSSFPRPIVLMIEPEGEQVSLDGKASARHLTDSTFLRLEDVNPASRLRWQSLITWQTWTGAAFFGGMFLLPVLMPWRMAHLRRKRREKERREGTPTVRTPDPAKVQEAYDKQKPQWLQQLLIMLPGLLIMSLIFLLKGDGLMPFLKGLTLILPSMASPGTFPLFLVGPLVVSALLCFGVEKWRERGEKQAGSVPPPDPDAEHKTAPLLNFLPLLPLSFVFLLTVLFQSPSLYKGFLGGLSTLPPSLRIVAILALLLVPSVGGMLLLGWWVSKKQRRTLGPGDLWFDQVQAMAAQAGVRVRHVVIVKSVQRNAYASVWGTVGITSKLLADLEPEEVQAIVAHEIGHHKASHPRRNFLLSLGATVLLMGAWVGLTIWLEKRFTLSKETKTLLQTPLFASFVLPFLRTLLTGKASRRHEYEADRFAVQVTGDPEVVIGALRKVHTLNAQPHLLKKSDELIHTHPSLANRIEAIRRDAGTAVP